MISKSSWHMLTVNHKKNVMIPKVSVIIPIYNTEEFLPKCIDSVRKQTLKEIEIILVDDESPDKSPQICDEYAQKDKRIRVIHKKNGGLGYARNSGLDAAIGEYVSFVDSDDFIKPEMMQILYETAKKYDADDVRSGTIFYNNGKLTIRKDVEEETVFQGTDEVKIFMLNLLAPLPEETRDVKYMMSVCLSLHRRSVIEENNVRFTSERETLSEDLIFDLDLLPQMNCIVCIPDCFYHYRMNPNSLSHSFSMEKYKKYGIFFTLVQSKLDKLYKRDEYILHFLRLQFLYFRTVLGSAFTSFSNFKKSIQIGHFILSDSLWNDLFKIYPSQRMPLKYRLYFYLVRHKFIMVLYIISKLK